MLGESLQANRLDADLICHAANRRGRQVTVAQRHVENFTAFILKSPSSSNEPAITLTMHLCGWTRCG